MSMRAVKRRSASVLATAAAVSGAVLAAPVPAHAAWGATDTISLQAIGRNAYGVVTDVGSANGTVQWDDGGNSFRYSLTICRQSGYVWPYLEIGVNAAYSGGRWQSTHLDFVYAYTGTSVTCYGGGYLVTGTETASQPYNAEFTLYGGYMDGSTSTFSTVTDTDVLADPY
jgi:hypothetical protein